MCAVGSVSPCLCTCLAVALSALLVDVFVQGRLDVSLRKKDWLGQIKSSQHTLLVCLSLRSPSICVSLQSWSPPWKALEELAPEGAESERLGGGCCFSCFPRDFPEGGPDFWKSFHPLPLLSERDCDDLISELPDNSGGKHPEMGKLRLEDVKRIAQGRTQTPGFQNVHS